MSRYAEIKSLIDGLEADFDKFYDKGVNAAGTRIRQGMQSLKVLAQEIRLEVQDKKNASAAPAAPAKKAPAKAPAKKK